MTEAVRSELAQVARRHKWDAGALYALVSLSTRGTFAPDSGIASWHPERTAVGLLPFSEQTARRFGVTASPHPPSSALAKYEGRWASWTVASMDVRDQLDLLERFYKHAFAIKGPRRPVDYFLAALGAAPGLPDRTVVALEGEARYRLELDRDRDGKIEVADLAAALDESIRKTRGPDEPGPMHDVLWFLLVTVLTRRVIK